MSDSFVLSNGMPLPRIGFGTWRLADGEVVYHAVRKAVEVGYRLFDTATIYDNEKGVGRALLECGLPRDTYLVTSKVWNTERGYDTTLRACEESLKRLQMDYLDLYLIHWPASSFRFDDWERINLETWRAMTRLYQEGVLRSIGVSNFLPHHLRALLETEVAPMVNQLEIHPGYPQRETVQFCQEHGILVEAWSPLGAGALPKNEVLGTIAAAKGRTAAEICLRWNLQHGVLSLPRTVHAERMRENLLLAEFVLSDEEMRMIDCLEPPEWSEKHPDRIPF
ncbi:MAG: aldo/keto reductase [Kiritimatiellia bacterium]